LVHWQKKSTCGLACHLFLMGFGPIREAPYPFHSKTNQLYTILTK